MMTLLEIVQNILSALESDEVNSIGDTVEALQIAEEVKTAFYDLMTTYGWPSNEGFIKLLPSNDPDLPTVMTIPPNVEEIKWIKYNQGTVEAPEWIEIQHQDPDLFFRYGSVYAQNAHPIKLVDNLYVRTDGPPMHWTTYNNNLILFDGYNSSVDDTLQHSKTLCWGRSTPEFEMRDDFVPPVDRMHMPLLLSEAKRMSFVNYKGVANANEERRNRNQRVKAQKHLWRANQRKPFHSVDYSRKRR